MIDTLPVRRSKYHGMLQILKYNWGFYATTLTTSVLTTALILMLPMPGLPKTLAAFAIVSAMLWMISSLLVSHFIYDRSKLSEWEWIPENLPTRPQRWINIHAGLDETSAALRRVFPETQSEILDIYDPDEMTESSIARARRLVPSRLQTLRARFDDLPMRDDDCDAVFVIFTAHELRNHPARVRFFRELRRVLKPQGRLLIVEHLRDLPNLLAFGPGAFHFYPRQEWLRLADEVGLIIERELRITPFVRVFVFIGT